MERDLFETYGNPAFEIRIVAKWIENYIFDEIIKSYDLISYRIYKNLNFHAGYDVEVVFFSIGMYVVVYSLKKVGLTDSLVYAIRWLFEAGEPFAIVGTGLLSAFLSATMNNLPTVMIVNLSVKDAQLPGSITQFLALANLVGTNIGPKLTPIGSLATLLWLHILEYKGVRVSWGYYMKVGFVLTIPVLLAVLFSLVFVYWLSLSL